MALWRARPLACQEFDPFTLPVMAGAIRIKLSVFQEGGSLQRDGGTSSATDNCLIEMIPGSRFYVGHRASLGRRLSYGGASLLCHRHWRTRAAPPDSVALYGISAMIVMEQCRRSLLLSVQHSTLYFLLVHAACQCSSGCHH
ncbi:hypothetical protein E2C01_039336 [Portunus trituberculatus]|uniref:Uncharacterized protein n=1 Tax=Portunus trituberculatus TaxID=210409 RepID=A0A5B7FDE4_PORTR|nr:hypothetical protein [Portunus trituberculatus]